MLVRRMDGLRGTDAMTEPYPGFPTDIQAQFMVRMMSVAEGRRDGDGDHLREPLHACAAS